MPPLDPASEDKHAPVKPAAARRPAVAPPSATAWRALIIMRASGRPTRVRFAPKADKTLDRSENRDLTGCSKRARLFARAASRQDAAAPPTRVMNSRRLMELPGQGSRT
jgi:hypothetical protein